MQQWAEMGFTFYRKIFVDESAFFYMNLNFLNIYLQLETKNPSQVEF